MTCFDYNRKERIKEFLLPNSASVYIRANIRAILPIRADLKYIRASLTVDLRKNSFIQPW